MVDDDSIHVHSLLPDVPCSPWSQRAGRGCRLLSSPAWLALYCETENATDASQGSLQTRPFCSRGSLVSPGRPWVLKSLCVRLPSSWAGFPKEQGKRASPPAGLVLTLTGQRVQRAGQLVTFHMPTQPVGTKLPSPCSPGGRCLQSSFWREQRCPETNKQPLASCSCCAAAKTSSEGIKGKAESRLLPEKLLKLKESEGFLKRSNLLRCSHCQTAGEPPFWGQRRASRYLLTLPETQLPHVGTL